MLQCRSIRRAGVAYSVRTIRSGAPVYRWSFGEMPKPRCRNAGVFFARGPGEKKPGDAAPGPRLPGKHTWEEPDGRPSWRGGVREPHSRPLQFEACGTNLSAVFYGDDLGVPTPRTLICALLVAGLGWLNEAEPQRLLALRAWPKAKRLRERIPKRCWHTSTLVEIRTFRKRPLRGEPRQHLPVMRRGSEAQAGDW